MLALVVTGAAGARLVGSPLLRPTLRVVAGGAIALAATCTIGSLIGVLADRSRSRRPSSR